MVEKNYQGILRMGSALSLTKGVTVEMNELKNGSALLSIAIYLYLAFQAYRFKKELKAGIQEDRTLTDELVKKWDKQLSRNILFIVLATLLGLVAVLINDIK